MLILAQKSISPRHNHWKRSSCKNSEHIFCASPVYCMCIVSSSHFALIQFIHVFQLQQQYCSSPCFACTLQWHRVKQFYHILYIYVPLHVDVGSQICITCQYNINEVTYEDILYYQEFVQQIHI